MAQPTIIQNSPITVENIATFRRNQTPLQHYDVPEVPQKRKSTDVAFLITFAVCIIVLLSLMVYTLINSDIQRFIHGYDSCGNVCGSKNEKFQDVPCSGKDMSDKPFLVYKFDRPSYCAESCNISYEIEFNRCYPYSHYDGSVENLLTNVVNYIENDSTNLIILCFFGLGLSILALLAYRFYPKIFIWTMLICFLLLFISLTGFIWYLYSNDSDNSFNQSFLILGIVFTIISIFFLLYILCAMSDINLIIYFFEEATRAVINMPLILLEPILTFVSNFIIISLFVYLTILIMTSGKLEEVSENDFSFYGYKYYKYVPDGVMSFVLWFNIIMMLWMLQFTLACQQMVISGAISAYYFARNKLTLVSPIYNSLYNLVRYHLGSAAYGSFIILVVTVIKIIIRAIASDNRSYRLFYICLRPLENILKYLTSMGYIEIAIHGQPLCRSSFRAINLIVSNLLSAVVMNNLGTLVFFMVKLVVVTLTVVLGLLIKAHGVIIFFGGVVAFLCVHCFFVVFETSVNTIFLCYCEDRHVNDGIINPYCATVDFHNHIKKVQAVEEAKIRRKMAKKNKK